MLIKSSNITNFSNNSLIIVENYKNICYNCFGDVMDNIILIMITVFVICIILIILILNLLQSSKNKRIKKS